MEDQNTLVVRDFPAVTLLIALGIIGAAGFFYSRDTAQWVYSAVLGGTGLFLLLTSSLLTIRADRNTGILTLRYRHLFWANKKEFPLLEIAAVQVERSQSSRSSSGPTYRVVLVTRNGETVPLRGYYSSGVGPKNRLAEKLRGFLGVGGSDQNPVGLFNLAPQLAQQAYQEKQEMLTGPQAEEHIKDGVHWFIQTTAFGGSGVTRWFSPDFKIASGFLYLAQKVAGQKSIGGNLLGGLGKMLHQQSLRLYGFGPEDTPSLEKAELLTSLDANLEAHFSVFGSDPVAARLVLNAWTVAPLSDWGRRYPLEQVQPQRVFTQLAVLFSPRGVYLASLGTLIPEAVDELTTLGVELVKAQGSTPSRA